MSPRPFLRLEGAVVFVLSLLAYHWTQAGWLQFVLLLLVPDLSMIGYVANARAGAFTYNAVHTYVAPLLAAAYSISTNHHTVLALSFIWIAHIGFDRMLGFGLKYPTRFKDTHLNPERDA